MKFKITEVRAVGSAVVLPGTVHYDDGSFLCRKKAYLSSDAVMEIVDDPIMTENEKKLALKALVVAQAQSWKLPEAQDAVDAMLSLAPDLPITINYDPLDGNGAAAMMAMSEPDPEEQPKQSIGEWLKRVFTKT